MLAQYLLHLFERWWSIWPNRVINTCVPDSFLMALYICYIHHVHIKSLFNSFEKLRALWSSLELECIMRPKHLGYLCVV